MNDHIYTKEKIYEFVERMFDRLESKKDKKLPMGRWPYEMVFQNSISEIPKHLQCKDENDTVDIGNYAFFIWYSKQILDAAQDTKRMNDHLYTKEKLHEFAECMYNRLESKRDKKFPMGGWSYERIFLNCALGIKNHIECHDKNDTIDISNFAFFIWHSKQIMNVAQDVKRMNNHLHTKKKIREFADEMYNRY